MVKQFLNPIHASIFNTCSFYTGSRLFLSENKYIACKIVKNILQLCQGCIKVHKIVLYEQGLASIMSSFHSLV